MTPSMFRKWQKEMRKYGFTILDAYSIEGYWPCANVCEVETPVGVISGYGPTLCGAIKYTCKQAILRHGSADK